MILFKLKNLIIQITKNENSTVKIVIHKGSKPKPHSTKEFVLFFISEIALLNEIIPIGKKTSRVRKIIIIKEKINQTKKADAEPEKEENKDDAIIKGETKDKEEK